MRETQSARIELHPTGCVIVRVREGVSQTLEHAQENVAASIAVSGGKQLPPLLVDITHTQPLSAEVRRYYTGGALAENFRALALVVEASVLGQMMGGVFVRMMDRAGSGAVPAGIPMRMFSDEDSAIAWLTSDLR